MISPLSPSLPTQLIFLFLLSYLKLISATPIQLCKEDISIPYNFCVAVSSYLNTTTSAKDLYITIITEHLNSSPK
jgi:hypothetical protein